MSSPRKCGSCQQTGHNKKTCPSNKTTPDTTPPATAPQTPVPVEEESADIKLIRDLANEVLDTLGAGHLESIYHGALKICLHDLNVNFETERVIPINFRKRQVGTVRADLIVEHRLVIELKSASGTDSTVSDAQDQCRIYMRETKTPAGIVVVFPKRVGGKLVVISA